MTILNKSNIIYISNYFYKIPVGSEGKGIYMIKIPYKSIKFLIPFISIILLIAVVITIFVFIPKKSIVAKVGNTEIAANMYAYSLAQKRQEVLKKYENWDEEDVWAYKADGSDKEYADEWNDWVLDQLIRTALINNQFNKLGLKLTDIQDTLRTENIKKQMDAYGGEEKATVILKKQGIGYDDFVSLYEDYDRYELLFLYYFGEDGKYPVSTDEIKNYYELNYVRIKSILIATVNEDGSAKDDKAIKEAAAKADEVQKMASAVSDTDKFDELITKYNEDVGVKDNPKGYILNKSYDGIEAYKTAAFDMKLAEIRTVKTEQGYYIMKKYSVTDPAVYDKYTESKALFSMKGDAFEDLVDQWKQKTKISIYDKVKNQYDIRNEND